jgi:hypothetical protein
MSFTTVIRPRRRAANAIVGKPSAQLRPKAASARPILHLKPSLGA